MVIILETLLSSIIIESPEIDLLLSEFSNAFAALSNDLYGTKVEIHEKDRPDGNAESIVKILSNLLMDSQSYNDSAFSLAVYDILQTITENKKASEKTKAYVNDVFISLLAYYLCSQMKARGISLEQWFKDLTTHNLSEDKIAFKDYIDLGCDLLPFDTQRALRFLCSRDIQYWRKKIICSLKYNAKRNPGVYTNFSKSFFASIELILGHLNIYRNMAAHSSFDYMDDRWLLRCLETIVLFTESFGFPVEKTLLEKRLFFERYRIYGNKMGKTFKCYSDVDYSLFSHTSIISVRDWKSITVKKETIDQTPVTIDILRERASEIVRRVFEPRSVVANEEIDKLIDYYRLNSVHHIFCSNRNNTIQICSSFYLC